MKRIITTSIFVSLVNMVLWHQTVLTTVVGMFGYAIGMLIAEKIVVPSFDKLIDCFKLKR